MHLDTIARDDGNEVADLVRAARGGDPDAWARIVENYNGMLRSRIRRFRLGPEDAQDVVQTTWLLAVQNLDRLRQERLLGSWLATIVTRECLKLLRRSKEISTDDPRVIERTGDNVAEADRELARIWLISTLDDVVAELSDAHRLLFRALTQEPEAHYADVARRLGRPVGSIGPTRARCFGRIRGMLEDREISADFLD